MIYKFNFYFLILAALFMFLTPFRVKGQVSVFKARVYTSSSGKTVPYRLFIPEKYDSRKKYPLVLWLHGGGGRGSDNEKQITDGNTKGASVWAESRNQSRFPVIVVAPQCPENEMWTTIQPEVKSSERLRLVVELIKELRKSYSIDADRLYAAGQSMGGYGTWALIAEYPKMFAAAIPICGGGNESDAAEIADTPIWAFHGELDRSVKVERSREMIAAIKKVGGKPKY
ncbi:MAG: prolyl oligopeptidase family serine peptidase, partial [Acidobacteria bacterium]|nr:prolyl oligopeptidase family serine peptidase [Acidobacteriota bacterium]